jgi:ketosteroid isomerase-like protein
MPGPAGRDTLVVDAGRPSRRTEEQTMSTPPPPADTLAANKRLAVRFLDLISDGDIPAMGQLITPTWTMEGGPPDLPAGHEGLRVLFAHIGGVQQRWTVDDVIAEGDRVVVRATNHCEQDSFFGVPGRGVVQVFTATFTMQIVDGRIARVWRNAADLQRLFQLGARILPPEPAASRPDAA